MRIRPDLARACVVAALLCAVAAHAAPWGPQDFPNPKRDTALCGRRKASNICDPDGILSSSKAGDRIEGIIKDIWEGQDPYAKAPCGDQGVVGYQVAVALMRRMERQRGEDAAGAARRIAKALHAKWGVGLAACDNGALLLLAVDDRQVYISTGKAAAKALSNNALGDIIEGMKPALRDGRYDEAVEGAVVDIGLGLAGRPRRGGDWEWFPVLFFGVIGFLGLRSCWGAWRERRRYRDCRSALQRIKEEQDRLRTRQWSRPRTCPVCLEEFSASPEEEAAPTAPTAPAAPGVSDDPSAPLLPSESGGDLRGLGAGGSEDEGSTSKGAPASPGLRRRNSAGRAADAACCSKAGADGAKGGAGGGPGRAPITLRCGHTFCEPCLQTWLDRAPTCPICRDRVDGAAGAAGAASSSAPQPPSAPAGERARGVADDLLTAELLFRLTRLQARYPSYITPGVMDSWADEVRSSGTFDWERAREFQLADPAARAHQAARGAGGNSYSFGGGGGGGGGGRGGSW